MNLKHTVKIESEQQDDQGLRALPTAAFIFFTVKMEERILITELMSEGSSMSKEKYNK